MVNVPEFIEFVDSGVEAESVTIMFAWTVFPPSAKGIVHAKLFVVPVIPVYNALAIRLPVIVFTIR